MTIDQIAKYQVPDGALTLWPRFHLPPLQMEHADFSHSAFLTFSYQNLLYLCCGFDFLSDISYAVVSIEI